jgi:hypothetical protein
MTYQLEIQTLWGASNLTLFLICNCPLLSSFPIFNFA